LLRAARIGRAAGLHYVYAGNLPGRVEAFEDTRCAQCDVLLVKRRGYRILEYHLLEDGHCPSCDAVTPGRWRKPS
jgi:pyruvate formate lyase activating enzyme